MFVCLFVSTVVNATVKPHCFYLVCTEKKRSEEEACYSFIKVALSPIYSAWQLNVAKVGRTHAHTHVRTDISGGVEDSPPIFPPKVWRSKGSVITLPNREKAI